MLFGDKRLYTFEPIDFLFNVQAFALKSIDNAQRNRTSQPASTNIRNQIEAKFGMQDVLQRWQKRQIIYMIFMN